jgi:hypothetical protein
VVDAYGASGVTATAGGSLGGLGGHITATVPVTAGATLYIYIGGAALVNSPDGGFNGGGGCTDPNNPPYMAGGGGATDIRTSTSIGTVLVIAGMIVLCYI